jgi:hypothetical protein
MKIKILWATFLIAFLFSNCSIDKRLYRPGFHIEWRNNKTAISDNSAIENPKQNSKEELKNDLKHNQEIKLLKNSDNNSFVTKYQEINETDSKKLKSKTKIVIDSCDLIVCNNGDEIDAKVLEIGLSEIKYKKCDNPNGPTISIKKADVLMIKYPNGTKDIIKQTSSGNSTSKNDNDGPKLNPLALTSMILGILSLLAVISYFMIAMGIVAIILGIVANKQIKTSPENYTPSSSKMAKAGVICGIVGLGILAMLLLL